MFFGSVVLYSMIVAIIASFFLDSTSAPYFVAGGILFASIDVAARITRRRYEENKRKSNIPANNKNLILSVMEVK